MEKLTQEEERVLVKGGTQWGGIGQKYEHFFKDGTYVCRRCGAPLYRSQDKFDAHCGWPSFDDEIKGAVDRASNGSPFFGTELHCTNCGAHLGHVFEGEGLTKKNVRHCVNSISMVFIPKGQKLPEVEHLPKVGEHDE